MTPEDRLLWLLLGVAIGIFLGWLTRILRDILEGVKEVDHFLKKSPPRQRDERGAVNMNKLQGVALLIVVLLTAFASWQSQAASNKVADTQDRLKTAQAKLDRVVDCNKTVLSDALNALNTRTSYTQNAAVSNVDLVKAQVTMFDILLHRPPYSDLTRFSATQEYNESAKAFIKAGTEAKNNAILTKYPEAEDLNACIEAMVPDKPKE